MKPGRELDALEKLSIAMKEQGRYKVGLKPPSKNFRFD